MTFERSQDSEYNEDRYERVTLMFVFNTDYNDVLLLRKTKDGSPFYNAPGGRVEPSDDGIRDAAIRETIEETGVQPINPHPIGVLEFLWNGGPDRLCYVYRANDYNVPNEMSGSDEGHPEWRSIRHLPVHLMWAGDPYWIQGVLDDRPFDGKFWFADDGLVEFSLEAGRVR